MNEKDNHLVEALAKNLKTYQTILGDTHEVRTLHTQLGCYRHYSTPERAQEIIASYELLLESVITGGLK